MASRNIRLFYTLETVLSLLGGIILPVYILYFRHYGLTLFQVALIAVVFETSILIFELPTGHFADRYGRRLSTTVGFLLFSLSGVIFVFFKSFAGFLIAEIIFGLAETFISGALEALVVDSLSSGDKEKNLPILFANRAAFKTSGAVIGMAIGGILAAEYLEYLFLPIIFLGSGAIISQFLVESGVEPKSSRGRGVGKSFRQFASAVSGSRAMAAIFAVGLLANFACEGVDQYWQVLLSEIKNISVSYFGFLTAAGALLLIISVRASARFYHRLLLYLTLCFALMALSIFLSVRLAENPAMAGLVVYFVMKDIYRPALSAHLNRLYNSGDRATFLSGFNLICSLGEVAAGLLAGILAANFGVPFVFYFSALAALVVPVMYTALSKK